MKPVFFIDYDNTIFSHRKWAVPQSALDALRALREDGCKVVIASGRLIRSTSYPPEIAGIFEADGLVSSNGAVVELDGELIWEKYFDPALQKRIMDFALEHDYCIVSGFDGKWYTSSQKRFDSLATNNQRRYRPVDGGPFISLYGKTLPSFFVADTEEVIREFEREFPETRLLRMGDRVGGADIIPRENGKTMGAARILERLGTGFENAVAIGDSMNDIDLIRAASYGIAMGNAMQEVRDAADYVAPDIDDGGLADAIARARLVKEIL